MKTSKAIKLAKTVYCGYIYSDGHAVIMHRERHEKAGEIEWCEVIEKIGASCNFKGRIVFHNPRYDSRLKLCLNSATSIEASEPSTSNGSENTKRMGLAVGSFTIHMDNGQELYWIRLPDVISDGLTYQPKNTDKYDSNWVQNRYWGHTRIVKVHSATTEELSQLAA